MAKRLKRNSKGSIILPSGERITPKEQKEFKAMVTRANRERQRLIDALPDVAKTKFKDFNAKNEFHIRKKSKSFNQFSSRAEFNTYKRSLKHIYSKEFEKKSLEAKYSNYVRALYNTYNSKANDIINYISTLSEKELKYVIDSEELEDITYVYYAPVGNADKLSRIQSQVNTLRTKSKKGGK